MTMTGPEHYREAERLLNFAASPAGEAEGVERTVAAAQVHATLALAAVTLDTAIIAQGYPSPMGAKWQEVTS